MKFSISLDYWLNTHCQLKWNFIKYNKYLYYSVYTLIINFMTMTFNYVRFHWHNHCAKTTTYLYVLCFNDVCQTPNGATVLNFQYNFVILIS